MEPVLLATDGSPSAEAAAGTAIDLAQRLDLPLVVVAVAHDSTPLYGYYGYGAVTAELRKIEEKRIAEILATVKERAATAGVDCETVQLEGLPGKEICKVARGRDARVIVVGAHGWGRVGRMMHGSVSTYVLQHAHAPVLVVRGDAERAPDAAAPVGSGATT